MREYRCQGCHASTSFVSQGADGYQGDRQVQETDEHYAEQDAAVKVTLRVFEFLGDIRNVLLSQERPEDQCGDGANRKESVRCKWGEVACLHGSRWKNNRRE